MNRKFFGLGGEREGWREKKHVHLRVLLHPRSSSSLPFVTDNSPGLRAFCMRLITRENRGIYEPLNSNYIGEIRASSSYSWLRSHRKFLRKPTHDCPQNGQTRILEHNMVKRAEEARKKEKIKFFCERPTPILPHSFLPLIIFTSSSSSSFLRLEMSKFRSPRKGRG